MTPLSTQLQARFFPKGAHVHCVGLTRGKHLLLMPTALIAGALDAIVGVGAALATIATLGRIKPLFDFTCMYWLASSEVISRVYFHALGVLNPQAEWNPRWAKNQGMFTYWALCSVNQFKEVYVNSPSFLDRHVVARLGFVLAGVVLVVANVFDAVIGIGAALGSFGTLGHDLYLNLLSYQSLRIGHIPFELLGCLLYAVDPNVSSR